MKISQSLLYSGSFFGLFAKVTMGCAFLDFFISEVGAENLAFYYSASAALTFLISMLLLSFAERLCSIYIFLTLHSFGLMTAIFCVLIEDPITCAKIGFVSIMGTNIVGYFSMWSLASYLISPFEAKRLFPWVGTLAQMGGLAGAILAIASNPLELDIGLFLTFWICVQSLQLGQGLLLLRLDISKNRNTSYKKVTPKDKSPKVRSLISILRAYRLPRQLTLFTFLYSSLWFTSLSLIAKTFEKSELDLTSLYGTLDLASALLATFVSVLCYPLLVRKLGLARIIVVSSFIIAAVFLFYLGFPTLTFAIITYIGFRLVDGGMFSIALSNKLTLYPNSDRNRIRLISDILAQSGGFFMVGFLFLLPYNVLIGVIVASLFVLVCLSFFAAKNFNADVSTFLADSSYEPRSNAIALFDQFESEVCYNKFMDIIKGDNIQLQIEAIETLTKTGNPKALPQMVELVKGPSCQSVKLVALSYIDRTQLDHLDPFIRFSTTNMLRKMGREDPSDTLRGRAIRILLTKEPNEETYNFLLQALQDENLRVVANALEGLGTLNYFGVSELLLPFLNHPNGRIRANTVIALWKYEKLQPRLSLVITEMLESTDMLASAIYAVGEICDKTRVSTLKELYTRQHQSSELRRGIPIALVQMKALPVEALVELLFDEDVEFATNVAYHCLRLDQRTLNEDLISRIYEKGSEARERACQRFLDCGGFCQEQIALLGGGGCSETHHFSLS